VSIKVVNRVPMGHFLFTCSDTSAIGCVGWPQYTSSQTDRWMDGRTDRRQYRANNGSYCMRQYNRL